RVAGEAGEAGHIKPLKGTGRGDQADIPAVLLGQVDEDLQLPGRRRSTNNDVEHRLARPAVLIAHAAMTPTRVASSRSCGLVVRRSRCSSSTTRRWTVGCWWTSWGASRSACSKVSSAWWSLRHCP